MFKNFYNSVWTWTTGVYPHFWSPTSSTLSAIKTPENTEEDPDEPDPADGGDTQME